MAMDPGTDLIGTMDGDITQIIGTIPIGVLATVGDIRIIAAIIVPHMEDIILHTTVTDMAMEIRWLITAVEEI